LPLRSLTGRAETDRAVDVEETLDASLDDIVRRRSFGRPFPSRLASGPLSRFGQKGQGFLPRWVPRPTSHVQR
jgi:hypothetical protein